jgi:3-methyladenine DNA glycosylase AlkD
VVLQKKTTKKPASAANKLSAKDFIDQLSTMPVNKKSGSADYYKDMDKGTKFFGVRMAELFSLAKLCKDMPLDEVEKLLNSPYYEARMGAVSIMDFLAREKKTTEAVKKELYSLYLKKHDRINNWDLVDRSAPYVVGGYLADRSRAPLYKLAKSRSVWERRTAIVSTYFFIRQNEIHDTFKIAEMLVHDKHELINKAVGSWIREAGKRDKERLLAFLNDYAATMPRITLRYAVEKLPATEKKRYMDLKKN